MALWQGAEELVAGERARRAAGCPGAAGGVARVVVMGDVGDLQELDDEYQEFLTKNPTEHVAYICASSATVTHTDVNTEFLSPRIPSMVIYQFFKVISDKLHRDGPNKW